jgi:hypothetical protein
MGSLAESPRSAESRSIFLNGRALMNSGRWAGAYSCVVWHIRSMLNGRGDRRLDGVISLSGRAERRIFALTLGPPRRRIRAQMFQFWRRLTNQMTHHLVGRVVGDHSLFRGPSNHVLSRQHVAQQVALGAYRA